MTRKKNESSSSTDRELYSSTYEAADSSSLAFQEWSDQRLNAEKWENDQKDKTESQQYQDLQSVHLPPSIKGKEWRRPSDFFPETDFAIYIDRTAYPDLTAFSQHLLDSQFIRSFISSIEMLCYLGNYGKLSIEYTSSSYVANTADQPWRPWHHVYSKCRAGKGEKHNPTVNKDGKYIVRLFWMGSWRKVYVDDLLPVNAANELLLPSLPVPKRPAHPLPISENSIVMDKGRKTSARSDVERQTSASKKSRLKYQVVIELWPFLLAKALMKVASLTWTEDDELKDFDIVQCLTAWMPHRMYTRGLSSLEIWNICEECTSRYKWLEDRSKDIKTKKKSQSALKVTKDEETEYGDNCYLTLCYNKSFRSTGIKTGHSFLVDQTRDIPLVKPSKEDDFPTWKHYRWMDWAIERGMIPPKESPTPIKCLKTIDPFRSTYENENPEDILNDRKNINESIPSSSERTLGDVESKNMSWQKSKDRNKKFLDMIPDISKWIDFEQISEHIKYLTVYYKPSKFKVKVRISNISCENISKEQKTGPAKTLEDTLLTNWKEIIRPETLLMRRNEPLYLFRDSLTCQTIIINLSQTGYQPVLSMQKDIGGSSIITTSDSECGLCMTSLLQRIKEKQPSTEKKTACKIEEVLPNRDHYQPIAHLVVSKCCWGVENVDDIVDSFKTVGSASIALLLKPGRQLFSLWISSEMYYVTQILSDKALCVGTLEEIYPLMAEEARSFSELTDTVVKSFGALMKAFGKPDFQLKLKDYYNSYKPPEKLDKYELKTIHDTFSHELFRLVNYQCGADEMEALKILFRSWQFDPREPHQMRLQPQLCYPPDQEEMQYVDLMKKSAIVIQSFFRGVYERSMLKRHSPSNKNYKKTLECLQKLHQSLFPQKGATLLRNFFNNDEMYDLREKYPCYNDIQSAILLYQFPTSLKILQAGWTFIYRNVFFPNSYCPLLVRIKLFCDFSNYVVRVFNNDTGDELKIHTNNVLVDGYTQNYNGYTILCYGWPLQPIWLPFKLVCAVKREKMSDSIFFPGVPTKIDVIEGPYVPNKYNIICKYLVLIKSEYVHLTVHFSANYPKARIRLMVRHQRGTLVKEVYGEGDALVPSVLLEYQQEGFFKKMAYTESMKSVEKKKSSTRAAHRIKKISIVSKGSEHADIPADVYVIEAFVEEGTWPLTAEEWKVVEKLKKDMLLGGSSHTEEKNNTKQEPIDEETANWKMELIYNAGDFVTFVKDGSREAEIRNMKKTWYESDPERYDRSQQLRNDFINENKIPNPDMCDSLTERYLRPEVFHNEILPPPHIWKPSVEKDKCERKLKTVEELENDCKDEMNRIAESKSQQEMTEMEFKERLVDQIEKYNLLQNWFHDCRNESKLLMESAYSLKNEYTQKMVQALNKAKKDAKKARKKQ